jgi:CRP-like cAMP-binding protein
MNRSDRPPAEPVALFAGLAASVASSIVSLGTLRTIRAGAVLCRQGDPAVSMFLLCGGRGKFVRTTADGQEVVLRWLGPGDCFGLGSLLAGPVEYMGTAQVLVEARVRQWEGRVFQAAAARHPRVAQNALTIVLQYFKDFGDRHLALLSSSAERRLARTLTNLGASSGRVLPSGVELAITNRDLGALADVGLYTVSRQLKQWEREGHLVKDRQRILIRHPESLMHE